MYPTAYTVEIGNEITERVAAGEALVSICRDKHMPARSSVYRWLNDAFEDDDDPRIAFCEQMDRARASRADWMFDDMLEVAYGRDEQGEQRGNEWVQRDKLRVDTMKWVLGRMDGRKYGEKGEVTLRGDAASPVQVEHRAELAPEQRSELTKMVQGLVTGGGSE